MCESGLERRVGMMGGGPSFDRSVELLGVGMWISPTYLVECDGPPLALVALHDRNQTPRGKQDNLMKAKAGA